MKNWLNKIDENRNVNPERKRLPSLILLLQLKVPCPKIE